jgi:predicted nucleic-acid-binding protein
MKKVLIDINIILDVLNKREDHISAAELIDLCSKKKIRGFLSSHEITTLSYFLEKYNYGNEKRNMIIINLLDIFSIIPTTEKILRESLFSKITDYEDAVIEQSGKSAEVDFIITRNIKDFKGGDIPCCNAKEALAMFEN